MADSKLQLFNLETMSGIFPGVRTRIFQRLRLVATDGARAEWALLSWYDDPAACVLRLQTDFITGDTGGAEKGTSSQKGKRQSRSPVLLRIEEPLAGDLVADLRTGLAESGYLLHACGSCGFWQQMDKRTVDGLTVGRCGWQSTTGTVHDTGEFAKGEFAEQSCLALGCAHWQDSAVQEAAGQESAVQRPALLKPSSLDSASDATRSDAISLGEESVVVTAGEVTASPKSKGLLGRVRGWIGQKQVARVDLGHSSVALLERSGVGAGTEPCFVCSGRLANLGALTVESAEGDKQTFSVWRCRSCYTFYLNSWIDRWERLDTLETEESHFRIAPAEALTALKTIQSRPGGDHPKERAERVEERTWFEKFISGREPISHQVKQGR